MKINRLGPAAGVELQAGVLAEIDAIHMRYPNPAI